MRRNTISRVSRGAAMAGVLLALGMAGCRRERVETLPSEAATVGAVQASVATLAERPFPVIAETPGTVFAIQRADLSPKVMGRIAAVYVREGDHVRAGQVLARLEAGDLAANVSQADAAVHSAGAAYAQAQSALTMQRTQSSVAIQQANAALEQAKAQLAKARQGPRPEQIRQADAAVQQAHAALEQAQAQLAKARQGPRPEQVAQADQAVERAKAALEQAQAYLSLAREGARSQQKRQAEQGTVIATQQVAQAEAGLAGANANLQTVQADYTRMKNLYDQDIIPKQKLDYAALQLEMAKQGVRQATAAMHQANAALAIAKEQASVVQEGARTQEITAAEKQVEQARAGYEQARQEAAMAHQGGRREDVTTAEEAVKQAQAALAQATQEAAMAHQGGRWEDIRAAEAAVKQATQGVRAAIAARERDAVSAGDVTRAAAGIAQAKAGLAGAQTMLGYSTITAPFSGLITARKADPGNMAMPQMPLLTIEDDSRYQLACSTPESIATRLRPGMEATVTLASLHRTLAARVAQVVPAADPSTRTFTVKVDLPRTAGVTSGLFGRLSLTTGYARQLAMHRTAVVERNGLTGVFIVDDAGKARYTLVKLGQQYGDLVQVLSGVRAGQRVVSSHADRITEGAVVKRDEVAR